MSAMDQDTAWRAVLAHELRSSLAAILGYAELLADGTLGPLHDRAAVAARRIGYAADQLLLLIQALEDGAADHAVSETVSTVPARLLIEAAIEPLAPDAEARSIHFVIDADDTAFLTRRTIAVRALSVALGAAFKVSAGATLHLIPERDPEPGIVVLGTQLDPSRDDPDNTGAAMTGAGLRLGLARRNAHQIGGDLRVESAPAGPRLRLTLPDLVD